MPTPAAHPSYTLRLEPLTMLAALSTSTSHIGLGATVSTTYSDPFSVARVFAVARSHQPRAAPHGMR